MMRDPEMNPRNEAGAISDSYEGVAFSTRPTARSTLSALDIQDLCEQLTRYHTSSGEHDPVYGT